MNLPDKMFTVKSCELYTNMYINIYPMGVIPN